MRLLQAGCIWAQRLARYRFERRRVWKLTDRELLEGAGFEGFLTVSELRASALKEVPQVAGVYVVLREARSTPLFLERGAGGHFRGRDPTVSVARLKEAWVPESTIVYIGKAGRSGASQTLRTRLRRYLDFGAGKPVGHWGGRFVRQLADAVDLVVCWRATPHEDPSEVERRLLAEFEQKHGQLPFANLKRDVRPRAVWPGR